MNNIEKAKSTVQEFIDFLNLLYQQNYGVNLQIGILEELTEELDTIWVFSYDSTSGVKGHELMGTSPLIVEKDTLDIYQTLNNISFEENLSLYMEGADDIKKLEKDENGIWDIVD